MASQPGYRYYQSDLAAMPPMRAIAETLLIDRRIRSVSAAEAYALALRQPDVQETDLEIYAPAARRLGLPHGARVLNNCHGKIIGRTAKARRFFNRLARAEQTKVLGDLREAVFDMQQRPLIKAHAVLGLDSDLMIRATLVSTEDDAMNVFNWLANFTPYDELADVYDASPVLPVQDILVIADNHWTNADPFYHNYGSPQLALVDEKANVIFNFGMRYFGERKKGTLTLAWTSGIRIGMVACHGGIKEMDFTACADERARRIGKRSIAFFGLSGTGKSSHTNAYDNNGTLPAGTKKVVLHDDAFQIDVADNLCRVWEPTLFDKTDSRPPDHPDWRYFISVQNHALVEVQGRVLPLGQDIRNANGRALLDRDVLGEHVNRCGFPSLICWLMKDTCLPPIVRYDDPWLAVAMGATLLTQRNRAENVSEEELDRLVFEPFANPFRIYELWKDVEAFLKVFEHGAAGFSLNSFGFWRSSGEDVHRIDLNTSLRLQTAILLDELEWEPWPMISGAWLPAAASIESILPGYCDRYHPSSVHTPQEYAATLKDRFARRREYLSSTDLRDRPELLAGLDARLRAAS